VPFINRPVLAVTNNPEEWVVFQPLKYRTNAGRLIVVPAGFVTDLASIPRLLYAIFPVNGLHRAAAILHDYLYERKIYKRSICDKLFLEAMKSSGVSYATRTAMYIGVRIGGWLPWNNRKNNVYVSSNSSSMG